MAEQGVAASSDNATGVIIGIAIVCGLVLLVALVVVVYCFHHNNNTTVSVRKNKPATTPGAVEKTAAEDEAAQI